MTTEEMAKKIIVPLDTADVAHAIILAESLKPHVGLFKIGLELMHAFLAATVDPKVPQEQAVRNLVRCRHLLKTLEEGIFWDGKLNDTPNTMRRAAAVLAKMPIRMFTVHASSGTDAIRGAARIKKQTQLMLGATVLTSLDEDTCVSIFGDAPAKKVLAFAHILKDEGADGVVCSGSEARMLREGGFTEGFIIVVVGVRQHDRPVHDQKRVSTPREALNYADYLVIGRAITEDRHPPTALWKIIKEMAREEMPQEA